MGFPTSLVLEKGSLHSEFECAICFSLVEYPVYTSCTHVFCKSCLQEWLNQKRNCPKCKASLMSAEDVRDLKTAQPLAWRILQRIRCKCPLHTQNCGWKGDYGDLQSHLVNSKTHVVDEKASATVKSAMARASAEAFKEQGNQQFRARAYDRAIVLYSKALSLGPGMANVFANRSAAYLQLGRFEDSLSDARSALKIDSNYVNGHKRLAKTLCEMGEFQTASAHLERHLQRTPELAADHQKAVQLAQGMSDGVGAMNEGKYLEARAIFNQVSKLTKADAPVLMALRAEMKLGKCDYALRSALSIIRKHRKNVDAYVVRAQALYLRSDYGQALQHLKEALRLAPDLKEARSLYKEVKVVKTACEAGRTAFKNRKFEESVTAFTAGIEGVQVSAKSPIWASLHSQRAQAYRRLEKWAECFKDCGVAISAQSDCKTAWTTRASALIALGKPEEAYEEMKNLSESTYKQDTMVRHWKDKAEFEIRKRKRPDYYEVLGVRKVASDPEIKVAYKKRALELHPDRVSHAGDETKTQESEEQFKLAGEALEILSDPMRRQLYDEGYDKQAIEERIQAAQRAAHNHQHRH